MIKLPVRLSSLYAAAAVHQVLASSGERGNPSAVMTVSPVLREKLVIRLVCFPSLFLIQTYIFMLAFKIWLQ